MVSGIQLKVSLARRQPQIEPINDATSSAAWATLGMIIYYFIIRTKYSNCNRVNTDLNLPCEILKLCSYMLSLVFPKYVST